MRAVRRYETKRLTVEGLGTIVGQGADELSAVFAVINRAGYTMATHVQSDLARVGEVTTSTWEIVNALKEAIPCLNVSGRILALTTNVRRLKPAPLIDVLINPDLFDAAVGSAERYHDSHGREVVFYGSVRWRKKAVRARAAQRAGSSVA